MKIALLAGHNVYVNGYFDNGASGNGLREADFVKKTVRLLIPLLESQGHTVKDCTPYNVKAKNKAEHHSKRAAIIKQFKPDVVLDIHLNAFNGRAFGSEVLLNTNNKVSINIANKVLNNLSKLGLHNRGLKDGGKFFTIKLNPYPSMIIEGAFIDNKSDMNKLTPEKYANSIAKAFGGEEEKVDIKNIAMEIDGKEQKVDSINADGKNYVDLRAIIDLLGLQIANKGSKPIITPRNELAVVNGLEKTIESIKLNKDTNFIKLRELEDLLNIDYIDKKIIIDK